MKRNFLKVMAIAGAVVGVVAIVGISITKCFPTKASKATNNMEKSHLAGVFVTAGIEDKNKDQKLLEQKGRVYLTKDNDGNYMVEGIKGAMHIARTTTMKYIDSKKDYYDYAVIQKEKIYDNKYSNGLLLEYEYEGEDEKKKYQEDYKIYTQAAMGIDVTVENDVTCYINYICLDENENLYVSAEKAQKKFFKRSEAYQSVDLGEEAVVDEDAKESLMSEVMNIKSEDINDSEDVQSLHIYFTLGWEMPIEKVDGVLYTQGSTLDEVFKKGTKIDTFETTVANVAKGNKVVVPENAYTYDITCTRADGSTLLLTDIYVESGMEFYQKEEGSVLLEYVSGEFTKK